MKVKYSDKLDRTIKYELLEHPRAENLYFKLVSRW